MANVRWTGNALPVAQVDTLTVGGTIEVGDLFVMTINGKAMSVAATTTVAATTADEIVAAWNEADPDQYPEFAEVTAEATSGGALTLTADEPGKPFTCTVATTESNGSAADAQTFGTASTVASSGPNYWNVAANWDTGAVPVDTNDVYIENSDIDILYGLTNTSIDLASLNISSTFTGQIGLPDNTGSYVEYRTKVLSLGTATILRIGYGDGAGSPLIRIDTGSNACTCQVSGTASPGSNTPYALLLVGNHASNVYELLRGSVGICNTPGDTGQGTVKIGYVTNPLGDVIARFGSGFTFATPLSMAGGTVEINSAVATINQTDGELTVNGSGGVTSLNLYNGKCFWNSTGTLATPVVGSSATLDYTQDMSTKTVTNAHQLTKGATVLDRFGVVTTIQVQCISCSLADVILELGYNKTYTSN